MAKTKIGILFGGSSREREISFAGGRTVYDNLNKSLFEPVPLFIDSFGNIILLDWKCIYKGSIRDFYPPVEFIPESKDEFQVYAESVTERNSDLSLQMTASLGKIINPSELKSLARISESGSVKSHSTPSAPIPLWRSHI